VAAQNDVPVIAPEFGDLVVTAAWANAVTANVEFDTIVLSAASDEELSFSFSFMSFSFSME
jgi:hypothetical protein